MIIENGVRLLTSVPTDAKPFMVAKLDKNGKGEMKSAACYAGFNGGVVPEAIAVLNHKLPEGDFHDRDEAYLAFAKWITSPVNSPWRAVLPKEYNNVFWYPEFIANHGYLMTDMDQPGNGLFNFLIAARLPMEYTGAFWLWWKLVKEGIHPSFAFWFTHVFASLGKPEFFRENFPYVAGGHGHHSLYAGLWGEETLRHFMTGDMRYLAKKSYREYNYYTPCNTVWGKFQYSNSYVNDIMVRYKGFNIYERYSFGDKRADPKFTLKEVLEIAHKEQERLGIVVENSKVS